MSSENATVNVSNISSKATEQEIRNFFSFCGKIDNFNLTPSSSDVDAALSATITFEKPSAARTALLLDNTQLQGLPIHVTAPASLTDLQHDAEQHAHDGEEIRQEDKPRTAIVAEYLAHGYVLGDKALQTSIELDEKHGISSKFTSYLNNLNSRFKVAEKTRAADTSYGITRRATQGMNTATRYLESALNTPTGQKVRAFYEKGSKQVLDIHNEARRLADLREAEEHKCTCATAGPEGQCNCAPGSCDCNTKAAATSSSEKPSGSTSEVPPPSYPAEKAQTYQ